jgi:hypothetical protein
VSPNRFRLVWRVLIGVGAAGLVGYIAYANLAEDIDPYLNEQSRYLGYRFGDDRLLRDLANGRIKPGDPIEDVLAEHPPDILARHGDYVTASYHVVPDRSYNGVILVARGGGLIAATKYGTDPPDRFFAPEVELGPDYDESLQKEYYRQARLAHQARQALAGFGAVRLPGTHLRGFGALIGPELFPFD